MASDCDVCGNRLTYMSECPVCAETTRADAAEVACAQAFMALRTAPPHYPGRIANAEAWLMPILDAREARGAPPITHEPPPTRRDGKA